MRIGINGAFLRRPGVGVGQVSEHVLRHLLVRPGDEYIIYTEEAFQGHFSWLSRADITVKPMLPHWRRDDLIRKVWWEKYLLPRVVEQDQCDAFISLYQSTTILPPSIHHTMIVHDIIPKLFPEYLNNARKKLTWWLTERAIRKATNIVTVSECSRQDVIRSVGVNAEKVKSSLIAVDDIFRVIPSAAEQQQILHNYDLQSGYIYHGGGFEVRKNTETLLHAYKQLKDQYILAGKSVDLPKLVLSGRPQPQLAPLVIDIERRIRELDVEQEVRLLGFVSQADLPAIYSSAVLFVYPSLYEGFGMPVLEAMCQRTAVVCSSAASLPEVGGDTVRYCDPNDSNDIAQQIDWLLSHPEERVALAERGLERSQQFSWASFVQDIFSTL
ncbi:MAG: glycosyltransferase family 1 protein [Candidatus Moraniibacteriota bacterium]